MRRWEKEEKKIGEVTGRGLKYRRKTNERAESTDGCRCGVGYGGP